jgi:hypothetical protein
VVHVVVTSAVLTAAIADVRRATSASSVLPWGGHETGGLGSAVRPQGSVPLAVGRIGGADRKPSLVDGSRQAAAAS